MDLVLEQYNVAAKLCVLSQESHPLFSIKYKFISSLLLPLHHPHPSPPLTTTVHPQPKSYDPCNQVRYHHQLVCHHLLPKCRCAPNDHHSHPNTDNPRYHPNHHTISCAPSTLVTHICPKQLRSITNPLCHLCQAQHHQL